MEEILANSTASIPDVEDSERQYSPQPAIQTVAEISTGNEHHTTAAVGIQATPDRRNARIQVTPKAIPKCK